MELSTNKNTIPSYKETIHDRLIKKMAGVAVLGALAGTIYAAPDIHPTKSHAPTYLETHQGQNPADIHHESASGQ